MKGKVLALGLICKKRSKNQSPADLPEHTLLTLIIDHRQKLLTTKTSVMMALLENFYQFYGDLLGDLSHSGARDWRTVRLFHQGIDPILAKGIEVIKNWESCRKTNKCDR